MFGSFGPMGDKPKRTPVINRFASADSNVHKNGEMITYPPKRVKPRNNDEEYYFTAWGFLNIIL